MQDTLTDEFKFDELYIATLILESDDETFSKLLKMIVEKKYMTSLLLKLIAKRAHKSSLNTLDFSNKKITHNTLKFINGIDIKSIDLSNCKTISNDSLFHLNGISSLEVLSLQKCSQIGNYGINQLHLANLKMLDLSDTCIDEYALDIILRKFKELRILNLSRTSISDKSMESLLLYEDNKIQQLVLNGCRNVTSSSIYAIGSLNNILQLNLTGTGFNKMSMNKLKDIFYENSAVQEVNIKVVYQLNLKYKDTQKNELYKAITNETPNSFISAEEFSQFIIDSEPFYEDISIEDRNIEIDKAIDILIPEYNDDNKTFEKNDKVEQHKISESKVLPKEKSVFQFEAEVKPSKQKKRASHQYEPLKIVNIPTSISLASIGCNSGDITQKQYSAEPFIHKSAHFKLKNLVYEM